ncbi:MAG: hypothetical protein WC782_09610 [Methylococcaceae bacterium]|jgi:hypothetical protein
MDSYHKSKKVRRIASVIYLLILAFIMTGTYFSQQQKAKALAEKTQQTVEGYKD